MNSALRGQLENEHAAELKTAGLLILLKLITCLPVATDSALMEKERNTHQVFSLGETLRQMIWLGLIRVRITELAV